MSMRDYDPWGGMLSLREAVRDPQLKHVGLCRGPRPWYAFVLANSVASGPAQPTQTHMLLLVPLRFHRRQIHRFNTGQKARRVP